MFGSSRCRFLLQVFAVWVCLCHNDLSWQRVAGRAYLSPLHRLVGGGKAAGVLHTGTLSVPPTTHDLATAGHMAVPPRRFALARNAQSRLSAYIRDRRACIKLAHCGFTPY